jgi:hypothetical protein
MGVRDDIVTAARGECGLVSNLGGTDGNKLGWERLKLYFEAALGDADVFARGAAYKDGIMKANQFVTWTNPDGTTGTLDWCGLFCVWAMRQANLDVKWVPGSGPEGRIRDAGPNQNAQRPARTDFDNLQPGDILVCHHMVHHCLVSAYDGTNLTSINGNSDDQGIIERTQAWSDVDKWYFYSVDDYPPPAA